MDKLTKVNVNGSVYQLGDDIDASLFYKYVTLNAAPTTSTLSYDGEDFHIGAVVRVADNDSITGYKFYRLHDITTGGNAIWSELDTGSVTLPETVTVHIATNQSTTEGLINNANVTVDGVTKTYTGSDLVFYVAEDTQYTITTNTPAGYSVSNNSTGTYTAEFWGSREATITYNTTVLTVSVTKENAGIVNNPTLTLKVNGSSIANPTFPYNVPTGASYEVAVTDTIEGYKTPNAVNGTATGASYEVLLVYEESHFGVWAYYSDGTLKEYNSADSSAIGVAVITENAKFAIDKVATNNNLVTQYGGYGFNLSNSGVLVTNSENTAKADFDGAGNTTKLINFLKNANDDYVTGAKAAELCRAAFDGQGHLGSFGEWNEAWLLKTAIDQMMTKIGGAVIDDSNYWTSTLYDANRNSWALYWRESLGALSAWRRGYVRVRAFLAL